jgi:hypothetical protein
MGKSISLAMRVKMWPTPRATDGPNGTVSQSAGALRNIQKRGGTLSEVVQFFPTPTVQDASNNGGPSQYDRNSLPLNALIGGSLNPTWVEWLMGFPSEWTALGRSETP